MKIALLANWGGTVHGIRWANALAERGHDIHLISIHKGGEKLHPGVTLHLIPIRPPFGFFLGAPLVRKELGKIKPDLLHVHRASGYGTLGRLTGFYPRMLSVWGADVYNVPYESKFSAWLVTSNIIKSDWVCSTSHIMAKQVRELVPDIQNLTVLEWGVDLDQFFPDPSKKDPDTITIGTVKSLEERYGIDLLIKGFAEARQTIEKTAPEIAKKMRLLIAGGGPQREKLEALANEVGVGPVTRFLGRIKYAEVPSALNQLDVYVAASRSDAESFGVAIIEASACAVPVIVARVGGLPEVVEEDVTGIIVERESITGVAQAIVKLVSDPALARQMGAAGQKHVRENYDWQQSVTNMENVYRDLLKSKGIPVTTPNPEIAQRASTSP